MFFGTKLIEYKASFDDLLDLWCFYSITAPHYDTYSNNDKETLMLKLLFNSQVVSLYSWPSYFTSESWG